ncbi:MAG TPA: Ig-like domain-containing protein [Spirochaetota bacterium]|nr:Ig-like domain-containing protein [Spirochaetota bacterium]HOR44332.1 Ig-like domain-containing protein [Spirochaetota bacterium]HPK55812.1 Ig-like domain-containing protein [Spirochaetota bacterium]
MILSIKAVNFDGSEISQLDIEPYKQFKLIVEAVDPDNNPLEYKFDSESGTFAGIVKNSAGCTAVFKTGSVKGGQNIDLWAGISDGKGAIIRQSYNLGTGKTGPAISAIFNKTIFKPNESIKLSVTANCSGFFQLNCDGNDNFDFEKDMYRYSYSPNKTTDFILGGPEFASYADIQLKPRADGIYGNTPNYNIVLVFRDGLLQTSKFTQNICVDGTPPEVIKDGFSPTGTDISTNPAVTVTFDEEIGYADSSCLKLLPDDGKVKLVSIDGKVVRFAVSGLKTSTPYTATVSGIKDIAGNLMEDSVPYSFTTISGNLQIMDTEEKTKFAAYRGFEESSVNLKASFKGNDIDIDQVALSVEPSSNGVSVDGMGKVTINPRDLTNENDVTVKIKAYQSSTEETAYYTITVEPWYPIYSETRYTDLEIITNNLNGRFRLMEDIKIKINANGGDIIPTIGSSDKLFTGIFDGGDKTLSSFKITASEEFAGLFAANAGTIKNLKVDNASFDKDNIDYVGIICGHNDGNGKIINCHVKNSTINAKVRVGGITGSNNGEIDSCTVTGGSITAESIVGGIVGYNFGTVKNAITTSFSDTEVSGSDQVGGFVGNWSNGEIASGCYSKGEVSGINNVGGFAGLIQNDEEISGLYSTSNVTGINSGSNIGGFAGRAVMSKRMIICHSTGTVNAEQSDNVGGLIGSVKNFTFATSLGKCYHETGSVSGKTNVGGLIGKSEGIELYSGSGNGDETFAECDVTGEENVGGLIGDFNGNTNLRVLGEGTNQVYSKGTVKGIKNVGGLIGNAFNNPRIINCYSESDVLLKDAASSGSQNFGGLIGQVSANSNLSIDETTYSRVENCYSAGKVDAGQSSNVGGLIGKVEGGGDYESIQIINSEYKPGVSAVDTQVTGNQYVGGLIGYVSGINISNAVKVTDCHVRLKNDAVTDVKGSAYVGGLIGNVKCESKPDAVTISLCSAIGNIEATETESYVGGLIGNFEGNTNRAGNNISQCFSEGTVKASSIYGGGLIGYVRYCNIINCYSKSEVIGDGQIGGLVGNFDYLKIENCYAVGTVPKNQFCGGLLGIIGSNLLNNDIINSFRIRNSGNQQNGFGNGDYDSNQLKGIGPYSNVSPQWDISFPNSGTPRIWLLETNTNGGFPYLRENPPQ